MNRYFGVNSLILAFMLLPSILFAQQTNFQFSPPPIPWFEFEEGQKDLKISGTLLHLAGEVEDNDPNPPDMGGNVSVYGGGVSAFFRYAFRPHFAIDIGGTVIGAGGDVGSAATMRMGMITIPVDLEFQPVRTDRIALILFGGFNLSWLFLGIDIDTGGYSAEVDLSTAMRGPQGGAQIAFKFPEWVISPFIMFSKLSGDVDFDIKDNTGTDISGSWSVTAATAMFYGIDIVYIPLDLTLSSIIQQVSSSGNNQGYRTYVLTVSYRFQLSEPSTKAREEKPTDKRRKTTGV